MRYQKKVERERPRPTGAIYSGSDIYSFTSRGVPRERKFMYKSAGTLCQEAPPDG